MPTDDDRFVLDALQSGDPQRLQEMATILDSLEDGEDEAAWQRWLHHAIAGAPLATIEWMLDHGVDLASADDAGNTPLLAAIASARVDRLDVLARLIGAGAPLNGRGPNGWTAAHAAAAQDDVEALRLLVEAGADLTMRTGVDDATPLDEARHQGCARAVGFLESVAAAPADGSPFPGWRPLAEGHLPMVRSMLENHGIRAEVAPLVTEGKHLPEALWVKAVDHARAVALVQQMAAALDAPASAGPWICAGCGEENDAAFDACWQCGQEHATG
jgi:hypothetical protein